ncbi:hypothetical protein PT313_02040 [Metamycoplasma hyosynoviae]|uniref:hypothetical protein n=2 Tax=Metamycoplasma hyosynoviae TaxID=29559 RepID=UPI0023600F4C|nr:hypothetical protein [Metamycoplasma hyosynoviae]MDD1374372.1 hypothetical protein [Metamycoplasma hyosynoviae]MDD7893944.1 hypothetical protein [Metamycoplasma hyosynoviae]MDD7895923.1 hypothetical protein [Metamycoplasma hyosynoviae]
MNNNEKNRYDELMETTPEDQLKYKNIGKKNERKKLVKKILFFSLSAVGIATVFGLAFGIKKPLNDLHVWKNTANLISEDDIDKYISYKKNLNEKQTTLDFIKELITSDNLENSPSLKTIDFKLITNDYELKIVNVIENTLSNSVVFDCLLISKLNKKINLVLPNIIISGFKKQERVPLNVKELEEHKKIYDLLDKQPISFKDTKEKLKEKIIQVNSIKNIFERTKKFRDIFYNGFPSGNVPAFAVYDVSFDETKNLFIYEFEPMIFTGTRDKHNGKKFNHFKYVSKNEKITFQKELKTEIVS